MGSSLDNWARKYNFYCDLSYCFSFLIQLALFFFFTFVNCSSVFLLWTSWAINHLHSFLLGNPLVCSPDLTDGYSNYCLLVSGNYILPITSIILRPPINPRMLMPAAHWSPLLHVLPWTIEKIPNNGTPSPTFLKDLMIVYSLDPLVNHNYLVPTSLRLLISFSIICQGNSDISTSLRVGIISSSHPASKNYSTNNFPPSDDDLGRVLIPCPKKMPYLFKSMNACLLSLTFCHSWPSILNI